MAKVSYANLKLKRNDNVNTFKIGETVVEVKQYLPLEDKYDLIEVALQEAKANGVALNPLLLDAYFYLNVVFMYTNISFTDKQRENLFKLYDVLESNGIISATIEQIPEDEFDYLYDAYEEAVENAKAKENSIGGMISNFIEELPKNAEKAAALIEGFDKEQFQEVIKFAAAANGGTPVNSLTVVE